MESDILSGHPVMLPYDVIPCKFTPLRRRFQFSIGPEKSQIQKFGHLSSDDTEQLNYPILICL